MASMVARPWSTMNRTRPPATATSPLLQRIDAVPLRLQRRVPAGSGGLLGLDLGGGRARRAGPFIAVEVGDVDCRPDVREGPLDVDLAGCARGELGPTAHPLVVPVGHDDRHHD